MISLVELGLTLTPNPVAFLSRQIDPATGTPVHVIGIAVIGSPGGTSMRGPPGPFPPPPPVPVVDEPPVPALVVDAPPPVPLAVVDVVSLDEPPAPVAP